MTKENCQCGQQLPIMESIESPLNQLLIQVENTKDVKALLQKDWKLAEYDIIINSLTEKMDEIDQWTFRNDQFHFQDSIFGTITLTEKSKGILYHFHDVLYDIREQIIQLKKEHMMESLDEFPEYHDLIYEDEY